MTSLVHANRRAVLIVSKLTMTHDRYRTKNGLFLLLECVNTNQERVRVFFYVSLGIGAYEKVLMYVESPRASVYSICIFPSPETSIRAKFLNV